MSVDIKYNGNTIASVESEKNATIPCKGKKMSSDIVITGACEIVYKRETIATVTDGQTATIKCNGKIMQDDITIMASEMQTLTAPTISLDGNTLTMTATDDKTQEFIIFVDGVETATVGV